MHEANSLISFIPDIQIKAAKVKIYAKNFTNDLSIDESVTIVLYTMEWRSYTDPPYYKLNDTLRTENR
ncbi:unnamed protein product [Adineta steineri]|uniref:Uncharacterized protein n=1 Tax=Adineta steineri TaxID=433720 RepID=A0A813N4V7_9BILA|nr:unnamed protein product [Adineta steineri]CAF3769497.1 unnamed protein product [Adineta steineri]